MRLSAIPFLFLLSFLGPNAQAFLCISHSDCDDTIRVDSKTVPSESANVRINPSSVPTEKGFGVETIYYRSEFDFFLVRGLGRVGAAVSPSNADETFFGAPAVETPEEYFVRKDTGRKYTKRKFTLATAFNVYDNKKNDLKKLSLNLGVMGRYIPETTGVRVGGGVTGVIGPLTLGYSHYQDQAKPYKDLPTLDYDVETVSLGLSLGSLLLDYSILREYGGLPSTVRLLTGTLFVQRALFTLALRTEESDRLAFDYKKRVLVEQHDKGEVFGAFQFRFTKNFMMGLLYNYYLLHEGSLEATLFF